MPCSVPSTPNQPHLGRETKTSFTIKWTVSICNCYNEPSLYLHCTLKIKISLFHFPWRHGGPMVSALIAGSSSPSWEHCVLFLGKIYTLLSQLARCINKYLQIECWVTLRWTSTGEYLKKNMYKYSQSLHATKPWISSSLMVHLYTDGTFLPYSTSPFYLYKCTPLFSEHYFLSKRPDE